jgi:PAS domain S-box-containing protein
VPKWRVGAGRPLRTYILALVLLFVVAAATSSWYGWHRTERETVRGAADDAAFAADLAAADVADHLAGLSATVAQLAAGPQTGQVFARPQDCALTFNALGHADGGHLDVLRRDGSVACSSRPAAPTDGRVYADAGWLAEALGRPAGDAAAAAPVSVMPVEDPRVGVKAMVFAAPVAGPDGAIGVVAGFLSLERLGPYLGERYGGPRGLEFIVIEEPAGAGDAAVVTRSVRPARWIGVPVSRTSFEPTGPDDRVDVAGARRLFGEATVSVPPGSPAAAAAWRLYASADRDAALASVRGSFGGMATVLGLGLLLTLAGTLLIHQRITGPIGQLGRAVRAAADDPRAHSVQVSGPREVTALARDFNDLLGAVDRELTERRRAEEAAREHEHNYRQLFVANPYPMFVLDARTLAVLQANDAAVAHYGHPREELTRMALTDLCAPDDAAELAEALARVALARVAPVDRVGPVRQRTASGGLVQVELTAQALSVAGRKVLCIVIDDVTVRERLERQLRQSQRLESLGQLAGGVAHDFNNLLGIIAGYAGMAAGEVEAAARTDDRWRAVHEDLTQVQLAVDRSAALTRQLLAFARVELREPRVLDLNSVVTGVAPLLRRTLGEDIDLRVQLDDDLCPVRADAGQLEQVLVNLAVNARDAMPGGGTLVVDTAPATVDESTAAQHGRPAPGEYVCLRVSDTGAGMSQDTIDRAFEPFFTTKPKGLGTGLGLATIYGIVTEAGGAVEIYSEPGHGTTVTALLPAVPSGTVPLDVDAPVVVAGPERDGGHGETVLVVEDNAALRTLTQRMLTADGYRVLAAPDGPEAIGVAERHRPIDLLLTDVVMPHMPGHALAERLRADQPGLPVVYVSGYAEPMLTARKTLPPGVTLLTKPVPELVLLGAVRDALDRQSASGRGVRRGGPGPG